MCGIGLVVYRNPEYTQILPLDRACRIIHYAQASRGPDNTHHVLLDKHTALCHQRLAIQDLSPSSNQPVLKRRYSFIFNGEIYNHQQLSAQFRVPVFPSDTLFLDYLFKHDLFFQNVELFEGPFSIIHYDRNDHTITCLRDRFGEKPLYYYLSDDVFLFASTVKAIHNICQQLHHPLSIDQSFIASTLKYALNTPLSTPFKEVNQVQCGSLVRFSPLSSSSSTSQTETVSFSKRHIPRSSTLFLSPDRSTPSQFIKLLEQSISNRLVSDVPIGSLLSGGLDSTIISILFSKLTSLPLNTYTVDFNPSLPHRSRVENLTSFLDLKPHFLFFTSEDFIAYLQKSISSFTSPLSDPACLPLSLLCSSASNDVTVLLSGDGADELFGGYQRYKLYRITRLLRCLIPFTHPNFYSPFISPSLNRLVRSILASSSLQSYLELISQWPGNIKSPLSTIPDLSFSIPTSSKFDPKTFDQNIYLPEIILRKSDSMSMLNSVELRLPFLSKPILDFSRSASFRYTSKRIFFSSVLDYLIGPANASLVYQPKKLGLTTPLVSYFSNPDVRSALDPFFTKQYLSKFNIYNVEAVTHLWNTRPLSTQHNYTLWSILSLNLWFDNL